jgi:hypothetical protein
MAEMGTLHVEGPVDEAVEGLSKADKVPKEDVVPLDRTVDAEVLLEVVAQARLPARDAPQHLPRSQVADFRPFSQGSETRQCTIFALRHDDAKNTVLYLVSTLSAF